MKVIPVEYSQFIFAIRAGDLFATFKAAGDCGDSRVEAIEISCVNEAGEQRPATADMKNRAHEIAHEWMNAHDATGSATKYVRCLAS